MRSTLIRIALALSLLGGVTAVSLAVPVGVTKKAVDPAKRMATVAGSGLDASLQSAQVSTDGSAQIVLVYKNGAAQAFTANPIVDNRGVQVSATVPAALGNALDAFNTQLSTMVANAAAASKLDL